MLNKIRMKARDFGFTTSETNVALFLVAATAVGGVLQAVRGDASDRASDFRDAYAAHDSAFAERSGRVDTAEGYATPGATGTIDSTVHASEMSRPRLEDVSIVNINTASESQLTALPGVGPSTAKKIVEYRQSVGRYSKIEDIMNVKSIGPKKFEKMKGRITTGRAAPAAGSR